MLILLEPRTCGQDRRRLVGFDVFATPDMMSMVGKLVEYLARGE